MNQSTQNLHVDDEVLATASILALMSQNAISPCQSGIEGRRSDEIEAAEALILCSTGSTLVTEAASYELASTIDALGSSTDDLTQSNIDDDMTLSESEVASSPSPEPINKTRTPLPTSNPVRLAELEAADEAFKKVSMTSKGRKSALRKPAAGKSAAPNRVVKRASTKSSAAKKSATSMTSTMESIVTRSAASKLAGSKPALKLVLVNADVERAKAKKAAAEKPALKATLPALKRKLGAATSSEIETGSQSSKYLRSRTGKKIAATKGRSASASSSPQPEQLVEGIMGVDIDPDFPKKIFKLPKNYGRSNDEEDEAQEAQGVNDTADGDKSQEQSDGRKSTKKKAKRSKKPSDNPDYLFNSPLAHESLNSPSLIAFKDRFHFFEEWVADTPPCQVVPTNGELPIHSKRRLILDALGEAGPLRLAPIKAHIMETHPYYVEITETHLEEKRANKQESDITGGPKKKSRFETFYDGLRHDLTLAHDIRIVSRYDNRGQYSYAISEAYKPILRMCSALERETESAHPNETRVKLIKEDLEAAKKLYMEQHEARGYMRTDLIHVNIKALSDTTLTRLRVSKNRN